MMSIVIMMIISLLINDSGEICTYRILDRETERQTRRCKSIIESKQRNRIYIKYFKAYNYIFDLIPLNQNSHCTREINIG